LFARLGHLGLSVSFTPEAKDFVADKGFDPNFGARPLKRALQNYVEDPLAEEMLRGSFPEGSNVLVDLKKDSEELIFINTGITEKTKSDEEQPSEDGDVVLEGDAPVSDGDGEG